MGEIISCIGSGNMGSALMKGIAGAACNSGAGGSAAGGATGGGARILLADADMEKAKAAAAVIAGAKACASGAEAAEKGGFIFLAVKPQQMEAALAEIAPAIQKRLAKGEAPALVSMAAGWSIKKIQAAIAAGSPKSPPAAAAPPPAPVARIMPNAPALISKGVIALAVSPEVPAEKTAELEKMLAGAGAVDLVAERSLDAVTGLSGSGPAFACMFIEALADGGVLAGLPRDKALRYAAGTVLGSAAMVLETGRHPGELKDMACSPGGTTIAGIAALEAGAFRSAVMGAVEAAWQRASELSAEAG